MVQPIVPDVPATPTTPCVLWTGRLNADGYGTIGQALAHRVAYIGTVGQIPPGLELDHLCRVRACIRIDHLEPVTHAENLRRSKAYRTYVNTCKHGHEGEYRTGSNGKRYCAGCKRDRGKTDRRRKVLGDPCGKGHTYDTTNKRGVCCSDCMTISGKIGMQSRWHG